MSIKVRWRWNYHLQRWTRWASNGDEWMLGIYDPVTGRGEWI